MNILSLQSEVVYGHVGQGAARFALQCLGHEVWAVPTVLLSSHAGYARVEGELIPAALMRRLVDGLDANGWLAGCGAVVSGYLGAAEHAQVVADAVRRVKDANAAAIYCLDPVFGDDGRAYAKRGVPEAMARELLPLADIVTPNAFELSSLTGAAVRNPDEALGAARKLGRPIVAATSVPCGTERIGTLALSKEESWLASTTMLARAPRGAGDLFAALFLHGRLAGDGLRDTLARAIGAVFHVLKQSVGAGEMRLVQGQNVLRNPIPGEDVRLERIA